MTLAARVGKRIAASALAVAVLAGCAAAGPPDRAPDVTGTVGSEGGALVLLDPSDPYFERMDLLRGEPDVFRGPEPVDATDLRVGEYVEVWIEGPCAESFPVQCPVAALRGLDE